MGSHSGLATDHFKEYKRHGRYQAVLCILTKAGIGHPSANRFRSAFLIRYDGLS